MRVRACVRACSATSRPQLGGQSGALIWGEQFGSGADDEAVGLVLGPESSAGGEAEETVGPPPDEGATGGAGGNPLYLTGWTRGALFSKIPGEGSVAFSKRRWIFPCRRACFVLLSVLVALWAAGLVVSAFFFLLFFSPGVELIDPSLSHSRAGKESSRSLLSFFLRACRGNNGGVILRVCVGCVLLRCLYRSVFCSMQSAASGPQTVLVRFIMG